MSASHRVAGTPLIDSTQPLCLKISYIGNTVFNKGWQQINTYKLFVNEQQSFSYVYPVCMLFFFVCSCRISVKRILILYGSGPPSAVVVVVLLCGAGREFQQSFRAVASAPETSMGCGWGRGAGGEWSIVHRGCWKLRDSRKMKVRLCSLAPTARFPGRSGDVGNIYNKKRRRLGA